MRRRFTALLAAWQLLSPSGLVGEAIHPSLQTTGAVPSTIKAAGQAFHFTVGVALTAEQVAKLTTDIVWLVVRSRQTRHQHLLDSDRNQRDRFRSRQRRQRRVIRARIWSISPDQHGSYGLSVDRRL